MEHASTFIGDLATVLVVAGITSVAFRAMRQPVVLGYLLTGLIVGPYLPIPLFADIDRIHALADFGVVLVMFSVGLEFSFRRLLQVIPAAGLPAMVQMSALAWIGILVGRSLGWGEVESIFLGACLAISSTMVVVRALDDLNVPRSIGELALGILVIQDLVAILLIAGLTAVVSGTGLAVSELAARAGELALFLVALIVLGLLAIPRTVRRLVGMAQPEMLVVAVSGLAFGMALLAEKMGYSIALGAFVAGSLVAESGEAHRIEALVRPIRDLFAAVFFVAVGMSVDPRLVLADAPLGLGLVAIVVLGQLASVTVGGILAGRGLMISIRTGAALGQIGEFSFIIATLGVGSGIVRPTLYSVVVLAALTTTFTTPIVLRRSERMAAAVDRRLPGRIRRLLSLYPSWLEAVSARTQEEVGKTRTRRLLAALVIDVAALAGLTVTVATATPRLGRSISELTGLPPGWGGVVVVTGAVGLALPFAAGLLRSGRALGRELAQLALPSRGGLDLALAPRKAMATLIQCAVVLLAALAFEAATQSFLPLGWGIATLLLTLAVLAVVFWRSSIDLDEHVRAGALALAEALLQRRDDPELHEIEKLLPGLGDLYSLRMDGDAPVVGKSLAALDLRGRTGATVLAVRRGSDVHSLPGGDWRIAPGDVLGLSGSKKAIDSAIELLAGARRVEDDHDRSKP